MKASLSIVLTAMVALSSSVLAGPVLDQHQDGSNGSTSVSPWRTLGQTFTAGLSGVLDSIELGAEVDGLPASSPMMVDIRNVDAGVPGDIVLGTADVTGGFADGWNSVSFLDQNIALTAGQEYSIVVYTASPTETPMMNVHWNPASYASGAAWERFEGESWQSLRFDPDEADLQFRTYLQIEPVGARVPAPGAVLLAGLGTGLVNWLRRKRAL